MAGKKGAGRRNRGGRINEPAVPKIKTSIELRRERVLAEGCRISKLVQDGKLDFDKGKVYGKTKEKMMQLMKPLTVDSFKKEAFQEGNND